MQRLLSKTEISEIHRRRAQKQWNDPLFRAKMIKAQRAAGYRTYPR